MVTKFEEEQGYRLCPLTKFLLLDALNLHCTRFDKQWGLTDCVSFVLMKQEQVTEALSADLHFRQAGFTPRLLGDS